MALRQENRWAARPKTALALKCLVYVLPFVCSALAANALQALLRRSMTELHWLTAAAISFPVALAILVLVGRATRRLLPLAMLLKLSLLFPDQVPSRFGVALRAASTKRLIRRLREEDGRSRVAEDLLALVSALSAHDRRTRGHSERVRAVTMLIADELKLQGEDRDKLEWSALLHDLGKLDVPPEILNKNGPPTDDEWEILRTHPAGGPSHAACLADWLGDWIHAMDQHHERFDGSGYPLGLRAEEIALSGRIVAVSDAFEVMTAKRSYKEPMTTQAARIEMVRCAGDHFDPQIVRAFMAISIGDINKALGPVSVLASIPFVGGVTNGLAPVASRLVLGGSVNPALVAAAAAILLATPVVDQSGLDRPPERAVMGSVVEDGNSSTAVPAVPAVPTTTGSSDVDTGSGDTPRPPDDEGEGPLPPTVDDLLPDDGGLLDDVVDDVLDDVVDSGEEVADTLLRDLGLDDVVDPLVDPLLDPLTEAVEEVVPEAVEEVVAEVAEEVVAEGVVEELVEGEAPVELVPEPPDVDLPELGGPLFP